MVRPSAVLFLLALAAGCGNDPTPTPDFDAHPVTVTPATQWAGGSITLSSVAFDAWPPGDFPLLVGGDVIVTAHRVSDSSYAATLPDTLRGGHYLLQAAVIESPTFEAELDVAGWTDTRSVAVTGTSRYSTPWPVGAPTGLVLVKDDTIRFIRATDGSIVTFHATTTTWRTPLGIAENGRLLAPLNDDTLLAWTFNTGLGTAAAIDTFAMTVFPDNGYYRLGNGGWFITDHNMFNFPGALWDISYITAPRAVVSSGAGRVVAPYRQMIPDPGGIAIFGTDSGTIRATVAGYTRLDAATFNTAGTALYLAVGAGGPASTAQSLLRVNPLTGAILDSSAALPGPRTEDLYFDEGRGWLLEAVRDSLQWTLRVRDAATLDLVAQMRSPAATDGCRTEGELHLLPAAANGAVYIGSADCFGAAGEVGFARFTLK